MIRRLWLLLVFLLAAVAAGTASPATAQPAEAPPPANAPANPHDHLQTILQRPLYQRWQLRQGREQQDSAVGEAIRAQLEKFSRWVGDWLESWFRSRARRSGPPGGLGPALMSLFWWIAWIALGLFVLALILLIVRLIRAGRDPALLGAVLSREQVAAALHRGDALALGGDAWLDEAGRLAAEKNFRAMYRALYLGLLSGLHAAGKIDFNTHCTNWTYVNRFRGETGEREVFSSLTDLFDSVWYGFRQPHGADIQSLRRQVESLMGPQALGDSRAH